MSSRIDVGRLLAPLRRHPRAWLMLAMVALIALPTTVWCGLDVSRGQSPAPQLRRSAGAPGSPGAQLRCWQDGRLVFDERDLELVPRAGNAVEFRARNGTTAYLIDMGSALCIATVALPVHAD